MPEAKLGQEIAFNEDLVMLGMEAKTSEEVIRLISDHLRQAGYVKPTFADAAVERERTFPTGLPTEIPVAIPHTDPEHCIHPALVVGVFKDPVPFGRMGAESTTVMAQMVFLLAICDPKSQVAWLGRLARFFQQPGLLAQVAAARLKEEVVQILGPCLVAPEEKKGRKPGELRG
jgi:PTS system galactitol-specific IIA component